MCRRVAIRSVTSILLFETVSKSQEKSQKKKNSHLLLMVYFEAKTNGVLLLLRLFEITNFYSIFCVYDKTLHI